MLLINATLWRGIGLKDSAEGGWQIKRSRGERLLHFAHYISHYGLVSRVFVMFHITTRLRVSCPALPQTDAALSHITFSEVTRLAQTKWCHAAVYLPRQSAPLSCYTHASPDNEIRVQIPCVISSFRRGVNEDIEPEILLPFFGKFRYWTLFWAIRNKSRPDLI